MFDEKSTLDPLGLETEIIIDDDGSEEAVEDVVDDVVEDAGEAAEDAAEEVEEKAEEAVSEVSEEESSVDDLTEKAAEETEMVEENAEEAEAETVEENAEEAEAETVEEETEDEAEAVNDKFLTEYPKEEFEQLIAAHFRSVSGAINTLRSKEDSITRLSKEVQKYREDYCAKNFKPIAMALISLRESCRKSLASLVKTIEFAKIKKFVGFLADDLDDLISDIGLECEESNGYIWTYNGIPLFKKSIETASFPAGFELEESEAVVLPETGDSLTDYLAGCEAAVASALKNISNYDKCINDYVKVAGMIDEGILAANVYPVLRALVHFAPRYKADVIDCLNTLTEENAENEYEMLLTVLRDKLEELLGMGGVIVESVHGGLYDLKKHKIIKLVTTDDEALDKTVESVSTDCYSLDGTVISQAKVNIYKYQPKND